MAVMAEPGIVPSRGRWPRAVRIIHWLVAVAVVAQVLVAWSIPSGDQQSPLWDVHFTLGITILVLVLTRIAVRLTSPPGPPLPPDVPAWHRILARLNQVGFYIILILMPISGWLLVGMSGTGPTIFGFITLPSLMQASANSDPSIVGEPFEILHVGLAWALIVTVALHLVGALYHGLARKDGVLSSMASAKAD